MFSFKTATEVEKKQIVQKRLEEQIQDLSKKLAVNIVKELKKNVFCKKYKVRTRPYEGKKDITEVVKGRLLQMIEETKKDLNRIIKTQKTFHFQTELKALKFSSFIIHTGIRSLFTEIPGFLSLRLLVDDKTGNEYNCCYMIGQRKFAEEKDEPGGYPDKEMAEILNEDQPYKVINIQNIDPQKEVQTKHLYSQCLVFMRFLRISCSRCQNCKCQKEHVEKPNQELNCYFCSICTICRGHVFILDEVPLYDLFLTYNEIEENKKLKDQTKAPITQSKDAKKNPDKMVQDKFHQAFQKDQTQSEKKEPKPQTKNIKENSNLPRAFILIFIMLLFVILLFIFKIV